jgi:Flp pilus assembly protein TadG
MNTASASSRKRAAGGRRGQALVEFAIATLVLLMLIFGVIEIARIFLVYTTITDAARQGVRYAITHGTPPAGPTTPGTATNTDVSNMQTAVQTVVKSFLAPGTVNINAVGLTINTTFPNISCAGGTPSSACSGTTPGNLVQVTVSYPYDLLISYFPINVTLAGTSQGVITW